MSSMPIYIDYLNNELIGSLISGAVGIMPTDTMYGIVASAYSQKAVERIYAIKHRQGKPGTIIASSVEQLADIGISKEDIEKASSYWPGSVSVVLPISSDKIWLHQGYGTVAVRIIENGILAQLLDIVGPLVTSSANLSSQPPVTTISEARNIFANELDFYLEMGKIDQTKASTIITFDSNNKVKILRQGVVRII